MLRQRFESSAVLRGVGVNRIVFDARANKFVVASVVQIGALETRRRSVIHPQRLYPSVPDVSRVRRPGHVAEAIWPGTAVARGQKLPLLQREVRQLINAEQQKSRRV